MSVGDLWGENPQPEIPKPVEILMEQASFLEKKTENQLKGHVLSTARPRGSESFNYLLEIVVPALDDYSFGVLRTSFELIPIYPVDVEDLAHDKEYTCNDEDHLIDVLKRILSSDEVRKVIQRLLWQISLEKPTGI